ncbi:N,N-dimethylformamidase beta subunit family domain-containing protein [Teichococcus oryzae]|uniref:N,N-dimethylformamidase n=1 Tax=Teichococcus oryzae TaxID=1608942 RepID=A0A5B2THP7_9PROT|nr:N,N-dimethylformamidase beta subunit family domain-containing protein [Pseudoroseomonas oryzae]KAA2214007.1 N,N-dimethylformamidase [Pseudoroseomonas oryzae]
MLPITGYVDRWSVKPGETLRFMISVQGGGRYRARVARVICGDPNPAGPGYREVPVPWALEGEHEGIQQNIQLGSWGEVPDVALPGGGLGFAATVWPTRLAAGDQAVLCWHGAAGRVVLGIGADGAWARVSGPAGDTLLRSAVPLTERAWHDVACVLDREGRLHLSQRPHRARLDRAEAAALAMPCGMVPSGPGAVTIAAERGETGMARHFNGKVENPRILAVDDPAALANAATLFHWDLSRAMRTDSIEDAGPAARHGRLVNLPTRAMTGSNWRGDVHRWTEDPSQYGAIHFHDDDIGDAGWAPSLSFAVPDDWKSGVHALHLELERDGRIHRDNIVFHVRARVPGSQAKIAFLAPTFSYTVYGQFQKAGRQALITPRSLEWGALPQAPDGHPEYGVSPYNLHSDGSGVVMSTMRRPLIDKRVNQIHLVDPSEGGSGLYWIAADSYVTDLLTRNNIDFEVITDHDVHAEGVDLLRSYNAVLTGQHPEYHSVETLDALAAYLEGGGRFMYLGGNGFYWKVVPHGTGPWSFELRRAEGGIRLWETLPGESYHAQDGSYGGLWRRLGRPPQQLVGVGFSTQGEYKGYPYSFLDGILEPRLGFMREGIEELALPGRLLGERGLMGGGAAGHELDRADTSLGTPHHAVIIGRAVLTDPTYQPVNEERRDHTWPAPREDIIRSDLTFFETPNGGAVFSVGSMNFIGCLPVDDYRNVAARLVVNIVRRFADPEPFPPP